MTLDDLSLMPIQNCFNLDNPDNLECLVVRYQIGLLSKLAIRIDRRMDSISEFVCWIYFLNVSYFQGSSFWHGAKFTLAPLSEAMSLRRKLGNHPLLFRDDLSQADKERLSGKLYKLNLNYSWLDENNKLEIQILTQTAEVSYDRASYLKVFNIPIDDNSQ